MIPNEIRNKVSIDPDTGCWHWTGRPHPTGGYGRWNYGGKTGYAHRRVWEVFVGSVPEDLDVGHKCHDEDPDCPGGLCFHRLCVNFQDHLSLMPRRKNMLDGKTLARSNAAKEFCPQSHEYTASNTLWGGKKGRQRKCKICTYKRNREAAKRRRVERRQSAIPRYSPR